MVGNPTEIIRWEIETEFYKFRRLEIQLKEKDWKSSRWDE